MKIHTRTVFKTSSIVIVLLLSPLALPQTAGGYDALVQKGKSQLRAGNSDQALAAGEKAIKLNRERWEAYALAGGALMNLKRYEEASDRFSKAIELAPSTKQSALRDLRRQCVLAETGVSAPASTASQAPLAQAAPSVTQAEVVLWKSIENSQKKSDFEAYLRDYPSGAFATLAKQHVNELGEDAARAEKRRLQQEQEAAKAAAEQLNKGLQCYDMNRHWDSTGRTDSIVSISPTGFRYLRNGTETLSASCSEITWQLEPHDRIMIRMRINQKKLDFKTGCDGRSPAFAAALERYCGPRSDNLW